MTRLWLLITMFVLTPLRSVGQTFTAEVIPDSIFQRMKGRSFRADCTTPRTDLRYLRLSYWDPQDKEQVGEMVVNRAIADDVVSIFRQLYDAHYHIGCMRLVDDFDADDEKSMRANNTSCFNFRFVSGTHTVSKHGLGMAIDINPLYNPYVYTSAGKLHVEPSTGRPWATNRDARKDIPMKIDKRDLCYKLFVQHGFRWGGGWTIRKDFQHFEK